MSRVAIALALAVSALSIGSFPALAGGRDKHVDCNKHGAISDTLARLDPGESNTVRVSGYCHENLVITGFDRLSLIAEAGTVIDDASGGNAAVIQISDSRVTVQGFTIRGGRSGLDCTLHSRCFFIKNTVDQGGRGVFFGQSEGQLTDSTIQDTTNLGLFVFHSNVGVVNVTISNVKVGSGISLDNGSFGGTNVTVENAAQAGILVQNSSHFHGGPYTVTHSGSGIVVSGVSSASLGSPTVTDNQGYGLQAQDFAYVFINGDAKFVRNGSYDIYCGQFWAGSVSGPLEIGSTNCKQPTVP